MSSQADGWSPSPDPAYLECPACKERAAKQEDGIITCFICKQVFHPDFGGFVKNLPEKPGT